MEDLEKRLRAIETWLDDYASELEEVVEYFEDDRDTQKQIGSLNALAKLKDPRTA